MGQSLYQKIETIRERLGMLKQDTLPADAQAIVALAQAELAAALQDVEQTQRDGDAKFQLLFASSPHPMWVYDLDTLKFLEVNQAAIAHYGYTRDEFMQLTISAIYLPEDLPRLREHLTHKQTGLQHSGEWRHRLKDGRITEVETISHALDFLGRPAALVAAQDITERKHAQRDLEQRGRDQAQIYRVSQMLASTLDPHQVMQRLLQAVTEIFDAEGGSVWLWDKARPGELHCQAAFHPNLEHLLIGSRVSSQQGVVGWVAHHGRNALVINAPCDPRFYGGVDSQTGFRTVSLLAVPLRVHDAVIGVLEVVNKRHTDFDDHDLALLETLGGPAAIAIDNALLVEAMRGFATTLQARNEELDAFAHTVAHDLKHPLTLMIGFTDALLHDYTLMSPAEHKRYLQNIMQSSVKMNNILDELMLLGEVRKADKQSSLLDMTGIVAQAQQRVADMIEQYRADITLHNTAAWPGALGYGPWLEEVWVNYLSNAIKYGGRPPRVEVGADSQPNGMVRFWVRDNGNGLAPEDRARLFTPFTRLDQVRIKGHGLGLSISQRIVEKLGGQVGVESAGVPGQGSTFFFTLPAAPEAKGS